MAAGLDARRRRAMYGRAVAHGVANTQCGAEQERSYGSLRLLTLATLHLPDLAVYGELLHSRAEEGSPACLVAQALTGLVGRVAARPSRAGAARALSAVRLRGPARAGVDRASEELQASKSAEGHLPLMLDEARWATLALTRATASTANDPMLVPGQIADALAYLLATYLVAVEVVAEA